jgi:type II secretory pathway predicted ATPase ExeA
LEQRRFAQLADEGDIVDDIHRKIDLLLHSADYAYCDIHGNDQMPPIYDPDSSLTLLTPEQSSVASHITDAVIHETHQLMFLQGSAGIGKTFTVKTLISALRACGKRCLICGATGIAAVQYPGGTTLHSLVRLGIDFGRICTL